MTEDNTVKNQRIHIRIAKHLVKHGKILHSHIVRHAKNIHRHIRKHHKKYIFGSAVYGTSHLLVVNILALKLLAFKVVLGALVLVGISNPSLNDIFAKMQNICINNHSIIAQQACDQNFDTIQDAVTYLENTIDPETDTIYNAQYYGIIQSLLGGYCDSKLDKSQIATETDKMNAISETADSSSKLAMRAQANASRKKRSLQNTFSGEKEFCEQKYLAYDMLQLSQNLFLQEARKQALFKPSPITYGDELDNPADAIVSKSFPGGTINPEAKDVHYTRNDLGTKTANAMATTIKNTSVNAVNDAINNLVSLNILTSQDKKIIKDKLIINFVSSCKKITGDHKIQKYFDGDATTPYKKSLEEISLNISLCDSYQYIDQLDQQVKKLAIHEIGHYIYYFKDNSPTTFQSICRDANGAKKDSCGNTSFITTYAQTNSEEDYAETFSRRALAKSNQEKRSGSLESTLAQKFTYFDSLF